MSQEDQPQKQQQHRISAAVTAAAGTKDEHCDDHKRECPFQDRPKLRWTFLIGLVVVVVAVIVVGVVFTVYYDAWYYSSGAFLLKNKAEEVNAQVVSRDVSVCGERQDSCQAYDLPNICCIAGTVCHSSKFSPSGVYCCAVGSPCIADEDRPPRCDGRASSCDKHLGGGCCAPGSECSAAGCLKVYRAAPGFATSGTQSPPTTVQTNTRAMSAGESGPAETGGVIVMAPKMGETAQSNGLKGIRPGFGFSSCPALEVVVSCLALVVSLAMVLRGG
ncbi:hypothetical protein F4677DRAFT_459950 [Hypoxylon crocopeplum]|nr:hypothetical protein F4677DRAFT_459950 [Hypoxylon crocopeplum]